MDWKIYIEKTKDKPSSLLLTEAISHAHTGLALDIGAGNLVNSKKLVEDGFKVIAVDPNTELSRYDGIEILTTNIEQFEFPTEKFALVNAEYSLPFTDNIPKTLQNIYNSLESGGIFSGQLFGKEDAWNGREGITTYTREEVETFFNKWEIIKFVEEKGTKGPAHGNKFWHVFHVIATRVQ